MATELGHSLWLVPPPGKVRDRLEEIIGDLAGKYSAPVFVPHMTLAPDISFAQFSSDAIGDFTRDLAGQISGFELTFTSVEGVPGSLYQCLYVKCGLTPELTGAVNLTRSKLGRDVDNPPFKPHISICYREDLDQETKSKIIADLTGGLAGLSFGVLGIQIWTNGEPISNWRQVGEEIPFHDR